MGPAIGAPVDAVEVKGLLDTPVLLGTPPGKLGSLLVFVAPGCSACAELAPALRSLERSDGRDLHLVVVSIDGDESGNRAYARSHRLDAVDYVTDPLAGGRYGVTATPYAMLLDHENVVRAKGIVNTLEQLESMRLVLPEAKSLKVLP